MWPVESGVSIGLFPDQRVRDEGLNTRLRPALIWTAIGWMLIVNGLSSCKPQDRKEASYTTDGPRAVSYDAKKMRTMAFEDWLTELTALPGDPEANINGYAGARIQWKLIYLAAEINTAYDATQALSPTNWRERHRMFSARIQPGADFGDIMSSPYPFQIVAVPDMGRTETRLTRGRAVEVKATIWGADGSDTIFLKDFVITATPPVDPPGDRHAGEPAADRPSHEAVRRSGPEYRVVYEATVSKRRDLKKGNLSKEVIRRIVHRHINEVKFCYERSIAKMGDIGFRGFQLTISGDGSVSMVAVAIDPGHEKVEGCMAEAIRKWTFPSPKGGGAVIVTYPMHFDGAY